MTSNSTPDAAPALHLHARNIRGVREVETDLDGITLIAGRNGAGKTSLAQAVAAAVTGQPPIAGLKKSEMHLLLRAGTAAGSAEVTTPGGRVTFTLPDGKTASEGQPPQASVYAAGVASVLDMPAELAADALAAYIDAAPTQSDLRKALPDLPAAAFGVVWQDVEATGWDGAHANAKENGARIKGRWEQVTGERYGLKKAAAWLPATWAHGLEDADIETLKATLADAQATYSEAIKAAAVGGAERARLDELAERLPMRQEAAAKASEAVAKAQADYDAAQAALEALPNLDGAQGTPCPHCGGLVEIKGRALVEFFANATPAQIVERNAARAAAKAHADAMANAALRARAAESQANGEVTRCEQAAAESAALPPAGESEYLDAEKAQAAVEAAGNAVDAFTKHRESHALHAQITAYASIVAALAPDGVRSAKLVRAMADFNGRLAALSEVAGYPAVRIETDLAASYGDRPYLLLSESEQYRARAIVQAAMATHDGSALAIFDRADLLDRQGRNGLMRLAMHLGIPAVICMTADGADGIPDLAANGLGRTVWLEGGEATA